MANKKNWWLQLLKNLITCESKSKTEGKTKGWRWIFGRFRFKQLTTSSSSSPKRSLNEAREEQRKHALNLAKATAAAAEAAVAAAQAAAEVVRLTRPCLQYDEQERENHNLAAIKIQTAFRGYLARKALRALKGVVRIQAIARGRSVRRRVSSTLKHLTSIHHHPSQLVHSFKVPTPIDASYGVDERVQSPRTNTIQMGDRSKLECKSQREWSDTLFSKDEIESIYLRKQEAMIRRERMKQYSFSHRERQYSHMAEETLPLQSNERHSYQRKQWAEDLDFHSTTRMCDRSRSLRIKPRINNLAKHDFQEEEVSSPFSHPRRSFCQIRHKLTNNDVIASPRSNSPMFPTYMAVTESAKAKMRSMSTPRQRLGYLDTCFEQGGGGSPHCNSRLYSWSSFNGDSMASDAMIGRTHCSQSKSLSMEVLHRA